MPARAGRSERRRLLVAAMAEWRLPARSDGRRWQALVALLFAVSAVLAGDVMAAPTGQAVAAGAASTAAAVSIPPYQQLPRLNQRAAPTGQPALLLLFAPDCRFCKQQARLMAALQQKCPAAQMALLGVQGERAALQQEVRQLQTPLPAFVASPALLRAIDGVQAVPTSLLVNADGTVLLKHRGMLNAQQLQLLSHQLLAPQCQAG